MTDGVEKSARAVFRVGAFDELSTPLTVPSGGEWPRPTQLRLTTRFESSTDKGQTWSYQDLEIESAIFYPPVEVSGSTVAVGAMAAFLSRDKAANWDKVPLGFPSDDWATAMHLINPNTLFVGTYYGRCARVDWSAAVVGRWRR